MDSLSRLGAAVFYDPARSGGLSGERHQSVGNDSAISRSGDSATQSGARAYHVGRTVSFYDSDGISRNGSAPGYRAAGHARGTGSHTEERSQRDHDAADRDCVSSITFANACCEKTQSEYSAPICWRAASYPSYSFRVLRAVTRIVQQQF